MLTTKKLAFSFITILVISAFITINYSDIFTKEEVTQEWYTGKEDHSITLEDASNLTRNFQLQAAPDQAIAGYFGKEALIAIISQDGAVGIRCYYGLDDEGTSHIVIVGVNSDGNDMSDGLLAQRMAVCPPYCPEQNDLNSPFVGSGWSVNN